MVHAEHTPEHTQEVVIALVAGMTTLLRGKVPEVQYVVWPV